MRSDPAQSAFRLTLITNGTAMTTAPRHDWTVDEVEALFALPFADLMHRAQTVHRAHHPTNTVQMSTLLSVKTGACPEDCAYCPQSVRYDTGLDREALMRSMMSSPVPAPRAKRARRDFAWVQHGARRKSAISKSCRP